MSKIIIKRQKRGRASTRFGILLKTLAPRYQRVLIENPIIRKNSTDDRFIRCLFLIEDSRIRVSHLQRPHVHPVTREISTFSSIKQSYNFLDWNCAYCKTHIKSNVNKFRVDNFVCRKCYKYYVKDVNLISESVMDSMIKFTDHYKKIIREDQQKFLKYIKRNEKKNSLL